MYMMRRLEQRLSPADHAQPSRCVDDGGSAANGRSHEQHGADTARSWTAVAEASLPAVDKASSFASFSQATNTYIHVY